jgi:hypothetical protein
LGAAGEAVGARVGVLGEAAGEAVGARVGIVADAALEGLVAVAVEVDVEVVTEPGEELIVGVEVFGGVEATCASTSSRTAAKPIVTSPPRMMRRVKAAAPS